MHIEQTGLYSSSHERSKSCSFPCAARSFIITLVALAGIAALTIGMANHFFNCLSLNSTTQWILISSGVCLELVAVVGAICSSLKSKKRVQSGSKSHSNFKLACQENRQPVGFLKSPYTLGHTLRFLVNHLTNGRFSVGRHHRQNMQLLNRKGLITIQKTESITSLKVVFLGDIMVSKSGHPPQLDKNLEKLLKSAHIIIANIEAPVIDSTKAPRRGFSLKFEMSSQYLKSICDCNQTAQWIFSIANNHACDTSDKNEEDISGVLKTIESIKAIMPAAEIIGAEIDEAKPILTIKIENGPKIGLIAWTEVMNNDKMHFKKKIVRKSDITKEAITQIKSEHDILIGFPHGNEEQSYYPLEETQDRWRQLIGLDKFNVIVGHGPHVIHPAELVHECGVLFHSIGNFCSPVGRSQTKLGCIPALDLYYDENGQLTSMRYKVNLLEQNEESISLLKDFDENATLYPEIIYRLRTIWSSLFTGMAA